MGSLAVVILNICWLHIQHHQNHQPICFSRQWAVCIRRSSGIRLPSWHSSKRSNPLCTQRRNRRVNFRYIWTTVAASPLNLTSSSMSPPSQGLHQKTNSRIWRVLASRSWFFGLTSWKSSIKAVTLHSLWESVLLFSRLITLISILNVAVDLIVTS